MVENIGLQRSVKLKITHIWLSLSLTHTHSQSSLISFTRKLHVAACSQHNMLLQSLTWACHTHIMAAVLYGCQWWQKLPLRHEPGWASGGPTIETVKASVHWVPWPSAGSHMVPLWPTPPFLSLRIHTSGGREGKERREVGRERGRVELEAWRQGEECEANKRVRGSPVSSAVTEKRKS